MPLFYFCNFNSDPLYSLLEGYALPLIINECMLKYMGFNVLFLIVVSNWVSRIVEFH